MYGGGDMDRSVVRGGREEAGGGEEGLTVEDDWGFAGAGAELGMSGTSLAVGVQYYLTIKRTRG